MKKNHLLSLAALSVLGMTSAEAARNINQDQCAPDAPATCYTQDDCPCTYCLGPENVAANPAVRPRTCNGDFAITVAGFYWNSHQDGMEYALQNQVTNPGAGPAGPSDLHELNNIIDGAYQTPNYEWDFGFKVGLGWNSACDGWDFGVLWTWYKGKANDQVETDLDDNRTLLPLWSGFTPIVGGILYATDIETSWNLDLNLVDVELGREFWNSKYLTLRPHVGLRFASIKQSYSIEHKGGSWSGNTVVDPHQVAMNNEVDLDNNFRGVGLRAGLDSVWNFGCGWGLYGNLAASIVYGKFTVDHDEENTQAQSPHSKNTIVDSNYSFRASRPMLDLALGVQWATMFCECQYGFSASLGWEHHLFFDQNQLWRVNRIGSGLSDGLPNNTGENTFNQRRGDLDTQGWTLTLQFEF